LSTGIFSGGLATAKPQALHMSVMRAADNRRNNARARPTRFIVAWLGAGGTRIGEFS